MPALTRRDVARIVDENEVAARTDWFDSLAPATVRKFGTRLIHLGRAIAFAVPLTHTAFFNRVIGLGVFEPADRRTVREIVEIYGELETGFMVHISPYARPSELVEWLREEGLEPYGQWIMGFRRAKPIGAHRTDLRLERIGGTLAHTFATTMCVASGMPGDWAPLFEETVGRKDWHHYLAFDGNIPVATASWFKNGPCAWMGNSATLAAYRKRGAHRALTCMRLQDLRAAGCSLSTGETQMTPSKRPSQSWRNHTRTGSRVAYVRSNYGVGPPLGQDILEPHQRDFVR
jgi:hypothetical protein